MITVGRDKDLGLVPEPPERDRMDDAVAITLKGVAGSPASAFPLGVAASSAPGGIGRQRRRQASG